MQRLVSPSQHDYSTLFESAPKKEKSLEDFLQEDTQPKAKKPQDRHKLAADKNPNNFGTRQVCFLSPFRHFSQALPQQMGHASNEEVWLLYVLFE